MPELAEVALYARSLNQVSRRQQVLRVSFPNQKDGGQKIIEPEVQRKLKELVGTSLSFHSRGKGLLLNEAKSNEAVAEFRLGMTGQFHLQAPLGKWKRHCFLEIELKDQIIHYSDARRFGRVQVPRDIGTAIGGFGGSKGFWVEKKPQPPKGFLTQSRISWLLGTGQQSGVGNYMANEALGLLKLSPFQPCRDEAEARALLRKCAAIAQLAFDLGAETYRDQFYNMAIEGSQLSDFCKFYGNPKIPRQVYRGRPVYSKFQLDS